MNKKKLLNSLKNVLISTALVLSPQFNYCNATPTENVVEFSNDVAQDAGEMSGYIAQGGITYSVDVYWADLLFVYDNGTYDPEHGVVGSSLPTTADAEHPITRSMAAKDVTAGAINNWYGFDGIRNRIIVLNRSNADITAQYAATTVQASFVHGANETVTALQLYDYAANNANNGYLLTIAPENVCSTPEDPEEQPVVITSAGSPVDLGDAADQAARFGNGELVTSAAKTLKAAPGNGTMYANKVFLNVTGTPVSEFTNDPTEPGNIGEITITFNKAVDVVEP